MFNLVLEVPDGEEVENDDEKLADGGYESYYMILNLGTLFITFIFMITAIPCFVCLSQPFKKRSNWVRTKSDGLLKALHGNMFLRFTLEGCLDIAICCYV